MTVLSGYVLSSPKILKKIFLWRHGSKSLFFENSMLSIHRQCFFSVTEKVYESESASEGSDTETMSKAKTTFKNDALHKKPREITAENKKFKAQASKNKNQSSLMSFFKKK